MNGTHQGPGAPGSGGDRTRRSLRAGVAALFAASSLSFIVVAVSYVVYSKLLSPDLFGLYAIASAIGTLGVTVLDGGMKNTVIKASRELTGAEEGTLTFVMTGGALALVALMLAASGLMITWFPAAGRDYRFLALFGALYLISWPFMVLQTAHLERRLDYTRVASIESVGLVLERALPVALLLLTRQGIYSFAWGLAAGRLFRVTSLNLRHPQPIRIPSMADVRSVLPLAAEGAWLQVSTAFCMVRDNLHVLLVGPLFGTVWVGYYAWGLQLSVMASQVFVQMSARVSLPLFASAGNDDDRWRTCLYQVRLLGVAIGPVLAMLLLVVPTVDARFFGGRWSPAVVLLPLLFIRMLSSLAATPLGPLLMVERGSRVYAQANIAWTVIEVVVSAVALVMLGPSGLAWTYATVGWIGLWLYLAHPGNRTRPRPIQRFGALISVFLLRPGEAIALGALVAAAAYMRSPFAVFANHLGLFAGAMAVLAAAYASERDVRRFFADFSSRANAGKRATAFFTRSH